MMVLLLTAASLTAYAVFTAAPVTLANNSITTGSANTLVCDNSVGQWRSNISSSFVIANLIPGEENEQELTEGKLIYLGNDGGSLTSDVCTPYSGTPGRSVIPMRFIPKVTFLFCAELAKDDVWLDFDMGEGLRSGYKSLREWENNTEFVGPVYEKNEAKQISVYASLAVDSQLQNANCKFDLIFHGEQASEE